LTLDNANPLEGWDIAAIKKSGKRHGVDATDIYGCLFFHVKDELLDFIHRVRDIRINIHLTQFDARHLPQFILKDFLKPFSASCFDRVETSNVADSVGFGQVLRDYGPLLNPCNQFSCLLINSMNWQLKEKRTPDDPDTMVELRTRAAPVVLVSAFPSTLTGIDRT
jgi:hypothetical protein